MNFTTIQKYSLNLLMGVMLLGNVSCSEETVQDNPTDKGAINFSAQVYKSTTRITENAWDGDERIGVKAGTETKAYTIDTEGKMTAEDAPFRWEGNSFDLTAWCPLTDGMIDLKDQTTKDKLFDCDLLQSHTTAISKMVHFTFKHQMTRMWWELQEFEGYTEQEVNNAKVSFLGYGAVSYANGEIVTNGNADQLINTYNTKGEYYRNGQAMMVPCDMWEKPLIQIEIGSDTYVYTPSKSNENDVAKKTGTLRANTWQRYYLSVKKKMLNVEMESGEIGWDNENVDDVVDAKFKVTIPAEVSGLENYTIKGVQNGFITDAQKGFSITYKENIPSGGIEYEGTCTRTRTADAAAGTVTFTFSNIHSDLKLSRTREYMEVGYYFNNDGTYGAEYNPYKAVGVIYKVGKHATDEAELYDGKLQAIHGYVVALTDETVNETSLFKWRDGNAPMNGDDDPEKEANDGHTTRYIGYANTAYLIGKAQAGGATAPAAATSATKNETGIINGTSGWYLPSRTQMLDLAAMAGKTAEGYTMMTGIYWTSSFDNTGDNAYIVEFAANGTIPNERNFWTASNTDHKVRLILTF